MANQQSPFRANVRDLVNRPGEMREERLVIPVGDPMGEGLVSVREGSELDLDVRLVPPLHLAAASGSAQSVTLLLDKGAEVDAREAAWQQTPLMFAASLGRAEVIRVLLARGADPKLRSWTVDGATASATRRRRCWRPPAPSAS